MRQKGIRSGSAINTMFVGLVDKYGQLVGISKNSKLTIQIDSSYKNNPNNTVYQPAIAGNTIFYSEKGVFKVENLQFTGTPGGIYVLKFISDAPDYNKLSNKEQSSNTSQNTILETDVNFVPGIEFSIELEVRQCLPGEKFTENGQCLECPANTSFSLEIMDKPGECRNCPKDKAICFGGSFIGPKPGYWRKSNVTFNFLHCVNPNACLGIIGPKYDPQGECREGYQGILCADCEPGFSRSSSFDCKKCPGKASSIVQMVAIVLIFSVVLIFIVRTTLKGASEKRNLTSVFQKILLNHIQLVVLTASFDFQWPHLVQSFLKINEPIGEVATSVFSFDCLAASYLQTLKNSSPGGFRMFYIQLLLFVLLPILICFISVTTWKIISFKHKMDYELIKTKIISTIVILLFFVHPNIVKQVFQTFYCLDIDGESRLKYDLEIKCFQGAHQFWSLGIAIPGMIFWGLGIPLFAFILLTLKKQMLEKVEVRQKLGFLFRGYILRYYYWEIVIMLRKIVLILIQCFLVKFGVLLQALVVFVLLILFLALTITLSPFQTVVLNRLEIYSLLSSMITVYCGIFYLVEIPVTDIASGITTREGIVLDESTKMFFFFLIIVSNFTFLISWFLYMYLEVKSILVKKFGKIYTYLCLCGNSSGLDQLQKQIAVREENEIQREKYMEILDRMKQLYSNEKLILNKKNIEKIDLYLQEQNVLRAAGIDPQQNRAQILDNKSKLIQRKYRLNKPLKNSSQSGLQDQTRIDADLLNEGESISNVQSDKTLVTDIDDQKVISMEEEFKSERISNISQNNEQLSQIKENQGIIDTIQSSQIYKNLKNKDLSRELDSQDQVSNLQINLGQMINDQKREFSAGKKQAQQNSILVVKVKQETNLNRIASEKDRKRQKIQVERQEKGYKKLRSSRYQTSIQITTPSDTSHHIQKRNPAQNLEEDSKQISIDDSFLKLSTPDISK